MKKSRRPTSGIINTAWMALLASVGASCGDQAMESGNDPAATGADTESVTHALVSSGSSSTVGANDLALDFAPPGDVSMMSFSATFQYQGVYPHTVYLYQPNGAQVVIRFTPTCGAMAPAVSSSTTTACSDRRIPVRTRAGIPPHGGGRGVGVLLPASGDSDLGCRLEVAASS